MACLVLTTSIATHGDRPHSKPPFWTALFVGLGTQAPEVEVLGGLDEVGDAVEETAVGTEEGTEVTANELVFEDVAAEVSDDFDDTAEVADDAGLALETDDTGGFGLLHLDIEQMN